MKKGKVFGKAQIALVLMVLALGAAVWLNMRFTDEKYLGEATYVDNASGEEALPTAGKVTDSFAEAKSEREKAYEEAEELIKDTLKSEKLSEEDKAGTLKKLESLADRLKKESNIETLLKAKGFEKTVAVIGDNNVSVIVKSDGLTTAQTLQIQDIITSETKIPLGNIKIVAVK